jgi:uncharacterized protein RhaS with RHS repeats
MSQNDSALARWLTPDPLGGDITTPQWLNRYAYALNNPTSLTDPLGLQSGGPCGNLQYGEGKGLCQTDVNGVIAAAAAFGPSSWDPFDLMDIPVVAQTWTPGTQVGTTVGGITAWGPISPGSWTTTTVGNAFGLFGETAPAPQPPVGVSWWGTFAKSVVTNFPATTWHSLTSTSGCINQFLGNTLGNLNPLSAGPGAAGEAAGSVYAAVKFNQALNYAATTPSATFGTPFLVYPQNSSVYRGLMEESASGAAAGAVGSVDISLFQALVTEYNAAKVGGCE